MNNLVNQLTSESVEFDSIKHADWSQELEDALLELAGGHTEWQTSPTRTWKEKDFWGEVDSHTWRVCLIQNDAE